MIQHQFDSVERASRFLKENIEGKLLSQYEKYDKGFLILPGGNTIKSFFHDFTRINVPWAQIHIALSDERCVPVEHDMSNEKQLKDFFLDHIKEGNYHRLGDAVLNILQEVPPVTVLSMGEDGHVASLFPSEKENWCDIGLRLYTTASAKPKRISLSEELILQSEIIYILVSGKTRMRLFLEDINEGHPLFSIFNNAVIMFFEPNIKI